MNTLNKSRNGNLECIGSPPQCLPPDGKSDSPPDRFRSDFGPIPCGAGILAKRFSPASAFNPKSAIEMGARPPRVPFSAPSRKTPGVGPMPMKAWGAQPPRLRFGAPSRRTRSHRKTRNDGLIPRAGCGARGRAPQRPSRSRSPTLEFVFKCFLMRRLLDHPTVRTLQLIHGSKRRNHADESLGSAAAPAAVRRALAPNPGAPEDPERWVDFARRMWGARARPTATGAVALPIPPAWIRLRNSSLARLFFAWL